MVGSDDSSGSNGNVNSGGCGRVEAICVVSNSAVAVFLAIIIAVVVAVTGVFAGGDSRRCGWVTSCCVVVRLLAAREWVGWCAGCGFVVGYSCPLLRDFRAETRLTVYRPVYIKNSVINRVRMTRMLPLLSLIHI